MATERTEARVLGAVLAGGRARRLGARGKSHLELGGRPLVGHVIERLRGQVDAVALNAPTESEWTAAFGLPVIHDRAVGDSDFAGPLIGLLSVLEWAAASPAGYDAVAVAPTDTPFLPTDFVARAQTAVAGNAADLACAASGGRLHPVVAFWPTDLLPRLRVLVVESGLRRADGVFAHFRTARIDYPSAPFDPLFNVNTPDDLAEAERIFSSLG